MVFEHKTLSPRPLFIISGVSRHHHPMNPLNLLNPHTAGMSKGKKPK